METKTRIKIRIKIRIGIRRGDISCIRDTQHRQQNGGTQARAAIEARNRTRG